MLYRFATNIELVNIKPLLLGEIFPRIKIRFL